MGWDNGVLLHQDMINLLAWKIGTWGAETKALTCAIDVGLSLESATSEGSTTILVSTLHSDILHLSLGTHKDRQSRLDLWISDWIY